MNLLFIGDIVGRPGRDLLRVGLEAVAARYAVDFIIVNGENSAGGNGITREIGDSLFGQGVDVITSGNHIWDKREAVDYIGAEPRLLRPANFPAGVPAESVRVLLKGPVLLIAGEKWVHGPGAGNGGYHLVERASGRFARAVRLSGAFDGARVRATLNEGELRITLPKLADRRGRGLDVPVTPVQGPVRS